MNGVLTLLPSLLGLTLLSANGWSPPSNVEPTDVRVAAPGARKTSLTVSAVGRVVVLAWFASRGSATWLTVSVSSDGGKSFGPPKQLGHANPTESVPHPSIAIVPTGRATQGTTFRILAAWPAVRGGQGGLAHSVSSDLGLSFRESFIRLDGLPPTATISAVTYGPSGRAHMLWREGSRLFYAGADTGGASKVRPLDSSASGCGISALAVGAADAVSAIWHRTFGAGDQEFAYARSLDGGGTFSAPVRVSHERWGFSSCPSVNPSLSLDSKGALRFVFRAVLPGNPPRSTFLADRSSDGRTFRPRVFLDTSDFADLRYPQLLPDREGGLSLVWDGMRNGRRYVMIRHSLGAPGGRGGLDADWMRPAPPIVLDWTGLGARPVIAPVPDGVLAAWFSGEAERPVLVSRRLSVDELCGEPQPRR